MGAHISGAHYNPVVTMAFLIRKDINLNNAFFYIFSQVLGSTLAALILFFLKDDVMEIQPNLSSSVYQILLSEILFTFLLVYVILNVATHPNLKGNSFYGFAIGLTVMAGAFSVGPISGGVFNPAVSIGPTLSQFIIGEGIIGLPPSGTLRTNLPALFREKRSDNFTLNPYPASLARSQ